MPYIKIYNLRNKHEDRIHKFCNSFNCQLTVQKTTAHIPHCAIIWVYCEKENVLVFNMDVSVPSKVIHQNKA